MVNEVDSGKARNISTKRYETNDVFNKKLSNNLVEKNKSIRLRNNLEVSSNVKKFVPHVKSKRPENVKNAFASQIKF